MTPLFKKLNLGTHETILVINAPESFEASLSDLAGVSIRRKSSAKTKVGFAIGFAVTVAERDENSRKLAASTTGDAVVWLAYPKKSSRNYTAEFHRDSDWSVLGSAGFEPVRQVAIDADWSALRFRRTEFIRTLKRRNAMTISAEGKRRTQK